MTFVTHLTKWFSQAANHAESKSRVIAARMRPFVESALPFWIIGWSLLACLKMATSITPVRTLPEFASLFLPYALIALAPILALRLTERALAGLKRIEVRNRFAFIGRWRALDAEAARRHPMFGAHGFMVSLMIGMLLNVVIRSGEFLLAVPALSSIAPGWGRTLFLAMAFEAMAMNFLYVMCFVMALRTFPLFPRMLALTWGIDLALQFGVARVVGAQADLPAEVAVALTDLLQGNITKVLISIAVWLPYLLLSPRVNLTYRYRLAA